MATTTYIKGVRTRYRTYLSNEIDVARMFLQNSDSDIGDMDETIVKTSKCLEKLKTYTEKLEIQSEKLACVGEPTHYVAGHIIFAATRYLDSLDYIYGFRRQYFPRDILDDPLHLHLTGCDNAYCILCVHCRNSESGNILSLQKHRCRYHDEERCDDLIRTD